MRQYIQGPGILSDTYCALQFIVLFIGCPGSQLLRAVFLQLWGAGAPLQLRRMGLFPVGASLVAQPGL